MNEYQSSLGHTQGINDEDCPICFQNVNFEINSNRIIKDISVKIDRKGITGIIGPSGSGKSTLLRLMNRLISATSGKISLDSEWYDTIPVRELRKRIGLVQQRPYLFPETVRDNLTYGPSIWGINLTEKDLFELLDKVALPHEFLDRKIENLSGGEQQRVSVARSLSNNPDILLLDEPTSALDIVSEEILEDTLRKLSQEEIKIIIVTHSLEQTKRLTDQLLFLKGGEFIEKTSTKEFFQKYNEEEIRGFFKKEKGE
ncbi:MAG: phosphate ABC transporter ATP-binding protein [Candidatus Heimdallarchaeota archaeon]|nr:MAG: phosphate ABC transporter ATP-binding protein [Candidatus Heimdallarchaeota archaeon]